MGTSITPNGPPGSNPLLPPGAPPPPPPDGDPEGEPDDGPADDAGDDSSPDGTPTPDVPPPDQTWRGARTVAGKFASSGGGGSGGGSPARVARSLVRAQGGAGRATANARAGRATLSNLGGFLSTAAQEGVAAAVVRFGLQFVGRTAAALLNDLARLLSSDGAIVDEAVARAALLDTFQDLFQSSDADGLDALNDLSAERVEAAMEGYVANYINAQLLHYLASRPIEDKAPDAATAFGLECQLKDFVRGLVKLEFTGIDVLSVDWSGSEGQAIVTDLFERSFSLISG